MVRACCACDMRAPRVLSVPRQTDHQTELQQALLLTWDPVVETSNKSQVDTAADGKSAPLRVTHIGDREDGGSKLKVGLEVWCQAPPHTCFVARAAAAAQALRQGARTHGGQRLQQLQVETIAPLQQRLGWAFKPLACLAVLMALATVYLTAWLLYGVAWFAGMIGWMELSVIVEFHKALGACSFSFLFFTIFVVIHVPMFGSLSLMVLTACAAVALGAGSATLVLSIWGVVELVAWARARITGSKSPAAQQAAASADSEAAACSAATDTSCESDDQPAKERQPYFKLKLTKERWTIETDEDCSASKLSGPLPELLSAHVRNAGNHVCCLHHSIARCCCGFDIHADTHKFDFEVSAEQRFFLSLSSKTQQKVATLHFLASTILDFKRRCTCRSALRTNTLWLCSCCLQMARTWCCLLCPLPCQVKRQQLHKSTHL